MLLVYQQRDREFKRKISLSARELLLKTSAVKYCNISDCVVLLNNKQIKGIDNISKIAIFERPEAVAFDAMFLINHAIEWFNGVSESS